MTSILSNDVDNKSFEVQLHSARGERTIDKGRCLFDGYCRSVSLQYGGLSELLNQTHLYRVASGAIAGRSIVAPHKRENMMVIITNFFKDLEDKNIIEFGAWAGGNAIFLAMILREKYPEAKVYALDTYEGMPAVDISKDMVEAGRFQVDGGVEGLRSYAASLGLTNIEFVKGMFQDTLPSLLDRGLKFGLAHIDADIYSACKYAQDTIYPAMTRGGYLCYDDCLDSPNMGSMEALEDIMFDRGIRTEQMYPHPVIRAHLVEPAHTV